MSEMSPLLPKTAADVDAKVGVGFPMLVVLACNTMNGPGLLALGGVFREAGWVVASVGLFTAAGFTMKTISLLCKVMKEEGREEFSGMARNVLGEKGFVATMGLLSMSLASLTCAQIVVTAQAVDSFLVTVCGASPMVQFYPAIRLITTTENSLTPFPEGVYGVSAGFLLDAWICVSLGRLDISENLFPQIVSATLNVTSVIILLWFLLSDGDDNASVPFTGDDTSEVLGVSIFNFAFVMATPSLYIASNKTSEFSEAMTTAVSLMFVVALLIGIIGGSYTSGPLPSNLLEAVLQSTPSWLVLFAVYGYCLGLLLPIPVYSILLKRNLASFTSHPTFYAIFFPWTAACICFLQPWFTPILNWSSLLCLGFVNFTIPLLLAARHPALSSSTRVQATICLFVTTFAICAAIFQNISPLLTQPAISP